MPLLSQISKRRFTGLVRSWRRKLHGWDPNHHQTVEADDKMMDTSVSTSDEDGAGPSSPFMSEGGKTPKSCLFR